MSELKEECAMWSHLFSVNRLLDVSESGFQAMLSEAFIIKV